MFQLEGIAASQLQPAVRVIAIPEYGVANAAQAGGRGNGDYFYLDRIGRPMA